VVNSRRPRASRPRGARRSPLDLLTQAHTLAHIKKARGINRVTLYRWHQVDPSFAQAYTDAMEAGTDIIEQEVWRRTVDGYDRPVFQGVKMAGVVRVYSDQLAAILLRGRRPKVYPDKTGQVPTVMSIRIHGGPSGDTTLKR
jgi:hypothetical protein